jgi:ketosteroid isomerase-like protein
MTSWRPCASASDSYATLFTADAIRIPLGSEPEYGPEQIRQSEQADYDQATWSIRSRPLDALHLTDDWIYGIADLAGTTVAHADGTRRTFNATKTWLLQRQPSGDWLIARQMWNLKP